MSAPDRPGDMEIATAQDELDAANIAELHTQLIEPPWDAAVITRLLSQPAFSGILFKVSGEPVGFAVIQTVTGEAEILAVGIAKSHQRQGLALKLMQAIIDRLKAANVCKVFLEASVANKPACALYEKLGFREMGRRKGYYQRPGSKPEDAINLALAI